MTTFAYSSDRNGGRMGGDNVVASSRRRAAPSDAFLSDQLAKVTSFDRTLVDAVVAAWSVARDEGEPLSTFLVRQGILMPDGERVLVQAEKGYFQIPDFDAMLDLAAMTRLAGLSIALNSVESGPSAKLSTETTEIKRVAACADTAVMKAARRPPEPASDPVPEPKPVSSNPDPIFTSTMPSSIDRSAASSPVVMPSFDRPPTDRDETSEYSATANALRGAENAYSEDGGTLPGFLDQSTIDAEGEPKVGSTLGKCVLMERVGQGGSGIVFRAVHRSLQIPVAVKVLRRSALEAKSGFYDRFISEARLLALLNHPNIVRVLDFEDDPSYPYLVLEHVEGISLTNLIHQCGRMQVDRALRLMQQVASGLKEATKLGIVHCDVTPSNILITRDGVGKLVDLGLAMIVDNQPVDESRGRGIGPGTAGYMAPEQAARQFVDFHADMYALGASFYHAIVGRPPFVGDSTMEVLFKHAQEPPVDPSTIHSDIDPG
ncbi:MAG: serine/threonine-protein kinase, partial [Planctomycetia bacterium]